MINDVFTGIDASLRRSLCADDGALWIRGCTTMLIQKKLQTAVNRVEKSCNKWGFRFSVDKTHIICFSKRQVNPKVQITPYGKQLIKQVLNVRL